MRPSPSASGFIAALLAVFSALEWVRVGSFQLSDLLLLALLIYTVLSFLLSFRMRLPAPVLRPSLHYTGLLGLLFLISLLSLRLPFIPLDEPTALQRPLLFSLARLLQFAATIVGFLWLVTCFERRPRTLLPALTCYWRAGVVSALWGLLSYAGYLLLHFKPNVDSLIGIIQQDNGVRVRGFFNEGGPFGLYLVSVALIGLLRRKLTGKKLGVLNCGLLLLAFLLSQSTAAFLLIILLVLLWFAANCTWRQRIGYGLVLAGIFTAATFALDLPARISGYMTGFATVADQIDPMLATGRISAIYIVPRMIAAHPFTGIGFGNYPFMRNDPLYLGPLPRVTFINDLPALGLPSLAAEIGLPATFWLIALICIPYLRARKRAAVLALTAAFQPLCHALGAQVTLFYPWFVSACALAIADRSPVWEPRLNDRKAISSRVPRPAGPPPRRPAFMPGQPLA